MSPADIERVFGLGRLKMVTGRHVEVYREEARPGERRRYTKRFLSTMDGDFREWTEREWRILARLVGHGVACVPEVVQFDRGAGGGTALVQTYDAGITVDQWATLLPLQRDGRVLANVFADRAHWWALACHGLKALDAIHRLEVIHLDIKADNVCIPFGPPHFRPELPGARLQPLFHRLALIDFAFSLVAGEALTTPLPIGRQQDYPYQSPRLLEALEAGRRGDLGPTRQLDWRCDLYSLAAMLGRYLPDAAPADPADPADWSAEGLSQARELIARIRRCHDAEVAADRPHAALIASCTEVLAETALAASLDGEWTLASSAAPAAAGSSPTPVTRIAPPLRSPAASLATPIAVGMPAAQVPTQVLLGSGPLPTAEAPAPAAEAPPTPAALPTAAPAIPTATTTVTDTATAAVPHRRRRASDLGSPGGIAMASAHDAEGPEPAAAASPPAPVSPPAGAPGPAAFAAPPEPGLPFAAAASQDEAADAAAPPPRAGTLRRRRRLAGLRRLALPAVIVSLVTAVVMLTAGGAWTALRRVLTPETPARPAAQTAPIRPPVVARPAPEPPPPTLPGPPALPIAADFGDRSLQLLAGPIPEIAGRTERALAPALALTDLAERAGDDAAIRQAVVGARLPTLGAEYLQRRAPDDARRLNEQARNAFWTRRSVREAFELQLRAFGANPLDAEIAGNLAYFHLKVDPPQPETARQLALHALTLRGANHPAGRWEDWTTLAVSSAMIGRDGDARRAFWLTLALTENVEKNCRAALNAAASYGPRVRPPAEAVLARVRARGQSDASPYCAWPPNWAAGTRFP